MERDPRRASALVDSSISKFELERAVLEICLCRPILDFVLSVRSNCSVSNVSRIRDNDASDARDAESSVRSQCRPPVGVRRVRASSRSAVQGYCPAAY